MTDAQIATYARELARIESAIGDELDALAATRKEVRERIRAHRERATNLMALILGKSGAQMELPAAPVASTDPIPSADPAPPVRWMTNHPTIPDSSPRWAAARTDRSDPSTLAFHLWVGDSAEAECGEVRDADTWLAAEGTDTPDDQYCLDCATHARRGEKPQAVHPGPVEEDQAAHECIDCADNCDLDKKPRRAPRTCLVPGCGLPGGTWKNHLGVKAGGGTWCTEHMVKLSDDERRSIYARTKAHKREQAALARRAKKAGVAA